MTAASTKRWLGGVTCILALALLASPAPDEAAAAQAVAPVAGSGSASATRSGAAASSSTSASGTQGGASAPAAPIDLNSASERDLETLPGVGPVTARKIVAGRPYASVADLARAGVPAKTIRRIAHLITVTGGAPAAGAAAGANPPIQGAAGPRSGRSSSNRSALTVPAPVSKVDLNHAGEKELETLPGVEPATARKIIAARPYSMVEDLARAGIPAVVIAKLAPFATTGPAAPPPTPKAPPH